MMLRVTKAISDIARKHFEGLLDNGAFPKIKWEKSTSGNGFKWKSYSMFDYSDTWATYMKLLDKMIKEQLADSYGIFTRKHSAGFLAQIETVVNSISEQDVYDQNERFRSFADGVRDYAQENIINKGL